MAEAYRDRRQGPLNINIEAVLDQRLGEKARRIPRRLIRWTERLICQDRLNEMLEVAYPRRGAGFCDAVLEHLGITVNVEGEANLPESRRVIIASNHPLGGLDGMALISIFTRIYGEGVKFVVNDLLNAVEPLSEVFLPVNKHGSQSRAAIRAIDDAMAGDGPVLVFPAGLCSRRRNGRVADPEWNKMFVNMARRYHRDIVPVHFVGENSARFYRTAQWRKRLGIRFNIEMALLPSEVFRAEGKTFTVVCGRPISWRSLGADARAAADDIRRQVYNLKPTH
ncbi:MAG: 1-acyl-sn-glycerol-3-phosphate acyltransferase [Bacteroidales bacterium]|nr:1-acyl-sn-glycerol-3-phosphate acyltransferase [Bacteroidales bacterium]